MATLQEKNKAVVQKYFEEYWGKGNVNVVDEVCTDNFVIDYPMHGPRRGKEAAKKMLLELREVRIFDTPCKKQRLTWPNIFIISRRSRTSPFMHTSSL